jgi:hypothetical protein
MDTALLIVLSLAGLVPMVFFLGSLQNALQKCAPASRTMKPGRVWLTLIPLFGLIWQFNVVLNLSDSLENEFARVGIPCPRLKGTMAVGVGMCICNSCVLVPVPLLRDLILAVGFVLWILYWGRIADLSRTLTGALRSA